MNPSSYVNNTLTFLVAARRQETVELEKLSLTCELVLLVSELVHRLQQERGASTVFLASGGRRFADLCADCREASGASQAAVVGWLQREVASAAMSGGARLYTRVAAALHALSGTAALREAIDRKALAPLEAAAQFNRIIAALLALVFEAADVAVDPDVSRLLVSLFHLMQGKEHAGQERANGAAALAGGNLTPTHAQLIEHLIVMQEHALHHFGDFAGPVLADWQAIQQRLPLVELEQLRRKLLTLSIPEPDAALADAWFDCCTRRIDRLHEAEVLVAEQLKLMCARKIGELRQQLTDEERLFASLESIDPLPPLAAFVTGLESASPSNAALPFSHAVVDMLHSQSQRLQQVTEELASVRTNLEERKLIERAKGILMAHKGLGEEAAYRLMRQTAMNQNKRIADIARSILTLTDVLPG